MSELRSLLHHRRPRRERRRSHLTDALTDWPALCCDDQTPCEACTGGPVEGPAGQAA